MTTNAKIHAQKLLALCDGWQDRACEAIDALAAAGENLECVRDAICFTAGAMTGQLLLFGLSVDAVNAAGTRYFEACEQRLLTHFPNRGSAGWPTMQSIQ